MMPKAGGEYVFMREAYYGRRRAFLYGWSYLVVSRGGPYAAQAVSTAIFCNILLREAYRFFSMSRPDFCAWASRSMFTKA